MSDDTISNFITGVFIGAGLTLVGGYFFGTTVLRKTLREHEQSSQEYSHHLQDAQQVLNDECGLSSDESDTEFEPV